MSRPRSAGSIFWGFLLIGVGMIFLLKNLGYEIPVWTGVARYWPVLLILWGVIKLFDYARWKKAGEPGPLFGAGEVILLIIVVLSGTALTAAANISPDLNSFFEAAGVDIADLTGKGYQYSEHYEKDVPSGSAIEIINRYGAVEVTASDEDRISVDVAKTIIASDEKEAEDLSKEFVYSIVEESGRYRIISNYNRDQNRLRGRRFKTSLTVRVPKKSTVSINNRFGTVDVTDLIGDQQVDNGFGATTLSRISGAVDIKSRNDRVVIEDISGPATISNEFGNIEARRVAGKLDLTHRNGNIEIEEIKGDTKVKNEFGAITAKNIQGSFVADARMTSVDVTRVENNVTIENQFQYVTLEDVKGAISVENRNGNVEIRYIEPPRNNVRVTNRFGEVKLVLPSSSSFSIDARTRFASVSTDFDELNRRDDSDRNSLTGQVGSGGPEIRIDNQNGNIHVLK
jgi:DUF4097 and DUF4098 domain-containing protein YvlB